MRAFRQPSTQLISSFIKASNSPSCNSSNSSNTNPDVWEDQLFNHYYSRQNSHISKLINFQRSGNRDRDYQVYSQAQIDRMKHYVGQKPAVARYSSLR